MKNSIFIYIVVFAAGLLAGMLADQMIPAKAHHIDHPVAQGTENLRTPGITQTVLLDTTLRQFPGKKALVFIGDLEPGAASPRHRHPGTEFIYILEGEGVMEQQGREPVHLQTGGIVFSEPDSGEHGFIHQVKNLDDRQRMKTLVLLIHDADHPPALPVK